MDVRHSLAWTLAPILVLATAASAIAERDHENARDDRVCALAFERSQAGERCELLRFDYEELGEIAWCRINALCIQSWQVRSRHDVRIDWVENRERVRLDEVEELRSCEGLLRSEC